MMRIHLESLRRFCPDAPVLISKKGGEREEMEQYRSEFGVGYWLEECTYDDALLRLMQRCETEYACIMDHDTVLLSSPERFVEELASDRYDLVGIEERVREPDGSGWFQFAPGYTDATFLLFNLKVFLERWGLRGIRAPRRPGMLHWQYHHGICERLPRHKYLRPYHTEQYGLGNLVKDGDTPVLWHQWYGSYRKRLTSGEWEATQPGIDRRVRQLEEGEQAFFRDYPALDISSLRPAWGPEFDMKAEMAKAAEENPVGLRHSLAYQSRRIRRWPSYGVAGLMRRAVLRMDRWRRLMFSSRKQGK